MKREAPEPLDERQFRDAVDHRLSGLREDPFLAQRIIANAGKEKKMKKKFSLGMAFALTLVLAVSVALAENWQAVSEFLSTIGSYPDLVTVQPAGKGAETAVEMIERDVIEWVYAPVDVTVVNEAGENVYTFTMNTPVAQIAYVYSLKWDADSGNLSGGEFNPPAISAIPFQNDGKLPFAPLLYVDSNVENPIYGGSFSTDTSDYIVIYDEGRYSITYWNELYLREDTGEIVQKNSGTVDGPFTFRDENGTVTSDGGVIQDAVITSLATVTPSPMPTAATSPMAVQTAVPVSEPAMNYGQPRGEFSNNVRFGLPYTLHYQDKDGNPQESLMETCDNMLAVLDQREYADGSDFGGKLGEVLTDYGLLILMGRQSDVDITFERLETPTVTAAYEDGGYTVRITGGKFRVQYPTDVYHETVAWQDDDGAWHFTPSSVNFLSADYAVGEYPYDFTFRLEKLPESGEEANQTAETHAELQYGTPSSAYYDTLYFGTPYTCHYTDDAGNPRAYTDNACTNMTAYFNRTQFEHLADFGQRNGTVETDYDLLLLSGNSLADVTFWQIEKPTVTAVYQEDGYIVRVTGGKFRVQYATDLYFAPEAYQKTQNGGQFIPSPNKLTRIEYAIAEYPYDFTFHLMNPLAYHTIENFGSELPPITHHYTEADGAEKEWELQIDHFEACLQEQVVTRLVDLTQEKQALEYQEDFITFRSSAIGDLPQVTVLEKPECVATPLSNGYELRVTGGLLRLRYKSVIWRQEAADGTIMMLASPDGQETYTTVEIPFDFTFTVPVYDDPLWEG